MNNTAITVLNAVIQGTYGIPELMDISKVQCKRFNAIVQKMTLDGFAIIQNSQVHLQKSVKATLVKKIASNWNLRYLLHDSNEIVFCNLVEPLTVEEIIKKTGLSVSSVNRIISELSMTGIIKKDLKTNHLGNSLEYFSIDSLKTDLVSFAKILKTENELDDINAELIFNVNKCAIKKILKPNITSGQLTSFSLFEKYGIPYNSPYDYYITKKEIIDIHDIIIHSVLISHVQNDKLNLVMTMVFYLHNKDKIDIIKLRKIAITFGVSSLWLDIEAYMNRGTIKDSKLFLPWNEFIQKVNLYDIKLEQDPAFKSGKLFDNIGKNIAESMDIFLIGGENMRLKKLKNTTKDCDLVAKNSNNFKVLSDVLKQLKYVKSDLQSSQLYPSTSFAHQNNNNKIDLFTKRILHDLTISEMMIQTAHYIPYGKLRIGILRNEYVFLLKAVSDRMGDIGDMEKLVQSQNQSKFEHGPFDWNLVWDEIINQEKINPFRGIPNLILVQLSSLAEQTDMKIPILVKLQRHVIEQSILKIICGGFLRLADMVSLLVDDIMSEKMIRRTIDTLVKKGIVKKYNNSKDTLVAFTSLVSFPFSNWDLTLEHIETYCKWRFPLNLCSASSPSQVKKFLNDMSEYGHIGQIDDIIIKSIESSDSILPYLKTDASIDAARACLK